MNPNELRARYCGMTGWNDDSLLRLTLDFISQAGYSHHLLAYLDARAEEEMEVPLTHAYQQHLANQLGVAWEEIDSDEDGFMEAARRWAREQEEA